MIEDQSNFTSQHEVMQPPPEEAARLEAARLKSLQPKKRNRLVLVVVAVAVLLLALTIVLWLYGSRPQIQNALPTPTPYRPPDTTKLEEELLRLQSFVDEANPALEIIAPPAVDTNLKI